MSTRVQHGAEFLQSSNWSQNCVDIQEWYLQPTANTISEPTCLQTGGGKFVGGRSCDWFLVICS